VGFDRERLERLQKHPKTTQRSAVKNRVAFLDNSGKVICFVAPTFSPGQLIGTGGVAEQSYYTGEGETPYVNVFTPSGTQAPPEFPWTAVAAVVVVVIVVASISGVVVSRRRKGSALPPPPPL
jgi:hypothetical protein